MSIYQTPIYTRQKHVALTLIVLKGFQFNAIITQISCRRSRKQDMVNQSINQIQFSFFISHSNCIYIVGTAYIQWGSDMSIDISVRCSVCNIYIYIFFFLVFSPFACLFTTHEYVYHDRLCTSQGPLKNMRKEKFLFNNLQ